MFAWLKHLFNNGQGTEWPVSSPTYKIGEVFTPSQPANKAFVRRQVQEADIRSVLNAPGTQALIWGESGAGKSSVAIKVLHEMGRPFVTTRCESTTAYSDILASAFSKTGAMQVDRTSAHDTATIKAEATIGGGPAPGSATTGVAWEQGNQQDQIPVVSVQISAESLAEHLGRHGVVWVLEDFHKVPQATRVALSGALKVFSDASVTYPDTAVVVLGASETPAEILTTPSNIDGRLSSIELPPLNDGELGEILDMGAELLNLDFTAVRGQIIRHSVGVASVTHALAYACCEAIGVTDTGSATMYVTAEALDMAKANYARTRAPEMKASFDTALRVERTAKWNNRAIILYALARLPESGGTHAQIFACIKQDHPDYRSSNLTVYLRDLQTDERGKLVRRTTQGVFRFDRPLQHAYAMLRFKVEPSHEAAFWSKDLEVDEHDLEASLNAIEEAPDAPDE